MSDEFGKWPSHFQKPGEEEEDHALVTPGDDYTLRTYSYTPKREELMMRRPTISERMYTDARALSDAELRRHYSISTSNGDTCGECFCCICGKVLAERNER